MKKIKLSAFFLILIVSILLSVWFLTKGKNKPTADLLSKNPKDVPELAAILNSSNQDEQLKATRSLAERIGPEQALDVLKDSGLPFTGEGHFAVHQIGYVAWERYGEKALLHCRDYFLYACYHGAVIEAASSKDGFETIKRMTDQCREFVARYVQCVHASGHAILAIWNYEADKALPTCDQLFESESQYPGAVTYCHSGVFMENIFGVHDWDKNKRSPVRKWLSETDLYYPCNAFAEKYQQGCWQNQGTRIYMIKQGDIGKTAQACQDANSKYVAWCFDSLARQIHPITQSDPQKVYDLCKLVGQKWNNNCVSINAGSYFSVGDPQTGIKVCNGAQTEAKQECFATLTGFILSANLNKGQMRDLCNLMEENYGKICLSQLDK